MSVTSYVKFNAATVATGIAAGVAGRAVKDFAEGVRRGITGSTSPINHAKARGRKNTEILAYPFTVDEDEQQGHYIMFNIYLHGKGKLVTPKTAKQKAQEALEKTAAEYGVDVAGTTESFQSIQQQEEAVAQQAATMVDDYAEVVQEGATANRIGGFIGGSAEGKINKSIQMSQLGIRQKQKTIALYMPPTVDVQYQVKYQDEEIGSLAMAGNEVIQGFMRGTDVLSSLQGMISDKVASIGGEALQAFVETTAETFAGGARALFELNRGTVITPRMELMFDGVGRRSFTFTFSFIPKNQDESRTVENIIFQFKKFMMPEYSDPNTRREMNIPATFEIDYYYRNTRNDFINRISTCFLKTMDVKYGGDRYTTYPATFTEGGKYGLPPQKSTMTLNFEELELLSRDHIEEGY